MKPSFEFSVTAPSGKTILDHLRVGPQSLAENLLHLAAKCPAARVLVVDPQVCSWLSALPEFQEFAAAGAGLPGSQVGEWRGFPVFLDTTIVSPPGQASGYFAYEFGRPSEGVFHLLNV